MNKKEGNIDYAINELKFICSSLKERKKKIEGVKREEIIGSKGENCLSSFIRNARNVVYLANVNERGHRSN